VRFNFATSLVVSCHCFSHAQILGSLQIQPELGAIAEPVAEAQGGVPCDGPLACDDLAHTVRRHMKLPGKLGRRDADFLQSQQ
jgi:hypothetical protein